jgi:hypothetical protein
MQLQVIVLEYLGSKCTNFTQLVGRADLYVLLFGVIYLA